MEYLEVHSLDYLQSWIPLLGGIILLIGINIRIVKIEDQENE